jgi:NAD(P)-dependent dehydrogenase (short-subunit alcohol dehydrogenase family)
MRGKDRTSLLASQSSDNPGGSSQYSCESETQNSIAWYFAKDLDCSDSRARKAELMDLQLKGKKVLVTGSTAGIGFAGARAFAAEGASVIINGRTQERVDAAIDKIRKSQPNANLTGVASDVSNAAGCAKLIQAVPDVDVLVNNMGIFEPKPFEKILDEDWFRFFEANVMSGVRLSRHYLSGMRKRNWGRILFVSSESAVQIPAEMIHYGMTKTAQVAIARGLAESVVGTGITVNSILPGPTRSEGVETFVAQMGGGGDSAAFEAEFFKSVRPSSLIKRFATTEEVASTIVYLCSPLASATTGAAIRADGGVVRAIL